MSDDPNQPKPETVPVATVNAPGMDTGAKALMPLLSAEQLQAMMQRFAALEELTQQQARQLDAMRASQGQSTGRVIRVHCNQCGADANADGTLKCGHQDFVNHIGHGNRILPNGDIETVIMRQTRIQ